MPKSQFFRLFRYTVTGVADLVGCCSSWAGPNTLVALDVDGTLLDAKDPILRVENSTLYYQIANRIGLQNLPHLVAPYEGLDPVGATWVRHLQTLGTHVIAFTAASGRFLESHGDLVPNWRIGQLSDLGFCFSEAEKEIVWDQLSVPDRPDIPVLKGGVLFSAGRSKGDVFGEYTHST